MRGNLPSPRGDSRPMGQSAWWEAFCKVNRSENRARACIALFDLLSLTVSYLRSRIDHGPAPARILVTIPRLQANQISRDCDFGGGTDFWEGRSCTVSPTLGWEDGKMGRTALCLPPILFPPIIIIFPFSSFSHYHHFSIIIIFPLSSFSHYHNPPIIIILRRTALCLPPILFPPIIIIFPLSSSSHYHHPPIIIILRRTALCLPPILFPPIIIILRRTVLPLSLRRAVSFGT